MQTAAVDRIDEEPMSTRVVNPRNQAHTYYEYYDWRIPDLSADARVSEDVVDPSPDPWPLPAADRSG
jgi:hypothetical protein